MSGYYYTECIIREDAVPIDNVNKFAWDDDDYEIVELWHEYTDEEIAQQKIYEMDDLKINLDLSDYKIIKAMEKFLLTIPEYAAIIGDDAAQRQIWRDQINELESNE